MRVAQFVRASRIAAWVLALGACAWARAGTAIPTAGVLGDSLADEYQFADDPADRQAARNFVELLAENGRLNFGAFTTADRGEPRGQGYAFNWARSGSVTSDLPGQTAGLVTQVASGQASLAFVVSGSNDLISLVGGADPTTVVNTGITNTVTAVQTLLAANPGVKVAVANLPDVTKVPGAQALLAANPALAPIFAQLSGVVDSYNAALAQQLAGNSRVALVDTHGLLNQIIANPTTTIPGVTFNTTTPGKSPDHLFIDPLHPGTLAQGLLANAFVNAIDSKFGLTVAPLTDAQIESSARAAAVPLPAAVWAMLLVLPMCVWAARRKLA